jgi:hypothetical protein
MVPGLDGDRAPPTRSSYTCPWRDIVSTPSASAGTPRVPPIHLTASRARRPLAVAGAVVLAATLLSACTGQPGAAAVVDGRRIDVSALQQGTKELAPYFSGIDQASVLLVLMEAPALDAVASDAGLGVSAQQASDALATTAKDAGTNPVPVFGEAAIVTQRFLMEKDALQKSPNATELVAKVGVRLKAAKAEVSPRYGALDMAQGTATAIAYPWLVASSDASAAPSASTAPSQ